MSQFPVQPDAITFVIRIWPEYSLSGPRWRGRIEHLQSDRRLAFEDLDRMLVFIRATGVFPDDPPRGADRERSES